MGRSPSGPPVFKAMDLIRQRNARSRFQPGAAPAYRCRVMKSHRTIHTALWAASALIAAGAPLASSAQPSPIVDKAARRFSLLCDTTLEHPRNPDLRIDIDLDAKTYAIDGHPQGVTGYDDGDRIELLHPVRDEHRVASYETQSFHRSTGFWFWEGHQAARPDAKCAVAP